MDWDDLDLFLTTFNPTPQPPQPVRPAFDIKAEYGTLLSLVKITRIYFPATPTNRASFLFDCLIARQIELVDGVRIIAPNGECAKGSFRLNAGPRYGIEGEREVIVTVYVGDRAEGRKVYFHLGTLAELTTSVSCFEVWRELKGWEEGDPRDPDAMEDIVYIWTRMEEEDEGRSWYVVLTDPEEPTTSWYQALF